MITRKTLPKKKKKRVKETLVYAGQKEIEPVRGLAFAKDSLRPKEGGALSTFKDPYRWYFLGGERDLPEKEGEQVWLAEQKDTLLLRNAKAS